VAAAANTGGYLLLVSPDGGWRGKDVGAWVQAIAVPDSVLRSNFSWEVRTTVPLEAEEGADTLRGGSTLVDVWVVDAATMMVVSELDTLDKLPGSFVLLLHAPPPSQLTTLTNTNDNNTSGSYLQRVERAVRPECGCLVASRRYQDAAPVPLAPHEIAARMVAALHYERQLGSCLRTPAAVAAAAAAAEWPPVPKSYDLDELVVAGPCTWWMTAGLWLSHHYAYVHDQYTAVCHCVMRHATALLCRPGGGELLLGVDSDGGVEGLLTDMTLLVTAATYASLLRAMLARAVAPWRDEWLRVVAVPVKVGDKDLLPAEGLVPDAAEDDVLVVKFTSDDAATTFRQGIADACGAYSLPLPLLESGTLPGDLDGERVVLRWPTGDDATVAMGSRGGAELGGMGTHESGAVLEPGGAACATASLPRGRDWCGGGGQV